MSWIQRRSPRTTPQMKTLIKPLLQRMKRVDMQWQVAAAAPSVATNVVKTTTMTAETTGESVSPTQDKAEAMCSQMNRLPEPVVCGLAAVMARVVDNLEALLAADLVQATMVVTTTATVVEIITVATTEEATTVAEGVVEEEVSKEGNTNAFTVKNGATELLNAPTSKAMGMDAGTTTPMINGSASSVETSNMCPHNAPTSALLPPATPDHLPLATGMPPPVEAPSGVNPQATTTGCRLRLPMPVLKSWLWPLMKNLC